MSEELLKNRDYTVIVAKTAAGVGVAPPKFEERWATAHDAIVELAQICERFDPDGITIYISSKDHADGCFKQYKQVTSDRIPAIFDENYPPEELNLLDGLQVALSDYFVARAANQSKPNGAIVVVLIDGEPRDRMSIVKTIVQATEQMETDEELGIGFAQVGDDLIATGFLTALDEDLRSQANAKFDIVHTRILNTTEPSSLTNFLTDIIYR